MPREEIVSDSEPGEIDNDRRFEFRFRALGIGVVDTQEKPRAFLMRKKIVEHGRARVADMQKPGRRRRKADERVHRASRKALVIG